MASYRDINYSLRPAKSAERKMLCDAMRRLSVFDKLDSYSYVGFGSTYFTDFTLFHKALGITEMISVEQNFVDKERFNFNKPYACIDIDFRTSNDVLAGLRWKNKKRILWLDYDKDLNSSMLIDISTFIANAEPGSMIVVSYKAQMNFEGEAKTRLANKEADLIKRLGDKRVSSGLRPEEISPRNLPLFYHKIVIDEIQNAILNRNGGLINKLEFKQLFNFVYSDDAQMHTLGGVLINQEQKQAFENASFDDLPFVRKDKDYFKIDIPNLTYKEIGYIDSKLHEECNLSTGDVNDNSNLLGLGIPPDDIKKYVKIYRYFPTFAEALF